MAMTIEPELDRPYLDEDDRAADFETLIQLDRRLYGWLELASRPAGPVRRELLDALAGAGSTGKLTLSEAELRHWASVFGEEIQIVRHVRNRLVHGIEVSDSELRGAVWMAARLLALVDSTQRELAEDE